MNESKYLRELTLNLRRGGFTVGPEADGLLPVSLDGQHLCTAPERGGVMYRKEDVVSETQNAALDKVIDVTKTTAEYMRQMEAAPVLLLRQLKYRKFCRPFVIAGVINAMFCGCPAGASKTDLNQLYAFGDS